MDNRRILYVLSGRALFFVIFFLGFIFGKYDFSNVNYAKLTVAERTVSEDDSRENSYTKPYSFINPLLDCGDLSNLSNKTINDLKLETVGFIDEQKTHGIEDVAVYFRDLNNGPWFGIKEKDGFLPASLLKVPLMLSLLKQAETDPLLLKKQVKYEGESRNEEYFKAEKELEPNHNYSLDDVLSSMIKYSDNNASNVLSYSMDSDTLLASFADLGIHSPNDTNYSISARTYATFFRILYNGTFLSKEYSEKALRLLSETDFDQGLMAGVPSSSIKISHKFGERQMDASTKQLHDCGIVYYPGRPYLLCIMTRGKNFDQLAEFISEVSRRVYVAVDGEK